MKPRRYTPGHPQPFALRVSSEASFLVDLHSHLSPEREVIGFLGGKVGIKTVEIVAAYPGVSSEIGNTQYECEMDPISEIMAKQAIEADGLSVVGWYHSHPNFDCIPSLVDVDNAKNYQTLFMDKQTGLEPFVALICSPYDDNNGIQSKMNFFYVEGNPIFTKKVLIFFFVHFGKINRNQDSKDCLYTGYPGQ